MLGLLAVCGWVCGYGCSHTGMHTEIKSRSGKNSFLRLQERQWEYKNSNNGVWFVRNSCIDKNMQNYADFLLHRFNIVLKDFWRGGGENAPPPLLPLMQPCWHVCVFTCTYVCMFVSGEYCEYEYQPEVVWHCLLVCPHQLRQTGICPCSR